MGKHVHAAPGPVLGKTISCRSHAALGDAGALQCPNRCYLFAAGRGFTATLLQAPQKEEFARWLKQADNPAASCHLPFSQVSSPSSLLFSENRASARSGTGWLCAPSSSFEEARLQLSCFSLQGCWRTELGVIFNHQNRADITLD